MTTSSPTKDGGDGDDLVRARDDEVDTVDCGAGEADVAIADRADSLTGCEKVRYPDTKSPQTRITSGPADVVKTRKRAVSVRLEFTSSEGQSTFECRVDGGRFQSCESPARVRMQVGNHVSEVRATDKAGNVDKVPASQEVTVKRRRR